MVATNDQLYPLAPARKYPKSHAEQFATSNAKSSLLQRHSSKFLVYILAFIVTIFAILLIIASIFLRIRTPDLELSSAIVKNVSHGNGSSSTSLNMTLVSEVSIKNANFGSFKYENNLVSFYYGNNMVVGSSKFDQGHVRARGTKKMNITTDLGISELSNSTELSRDIVLGMLELTSHATLSGKIRVRNFVSKNRSPEMNCTINLNLNTQAVQDILCN